jgi:hypothetical protein
LEVPSAKISSDSEHISTSTFEMSNFEIPNGQTHPTLPDNQLGNLFQTNQLLSPEQVQQALFGLFQRVQQHSSLFEEVSLLKEKLFSVEKEKLSLEAENESLKKRIRDLELNLGTPQGGRNNATSTRASPAPPESTPAPIVTDSSASSWAAKAASAPVTPPKRKAGPVALKKRIAAARAFQSPAAKGPQGFQYVYLGRSRKINRSEVRARLRRSGVDTGRILDISFPASGVLGVLMHVQYVEQFTAIMTKACAEIIEDFDPLNPKHLADPKYCGLDDNTREQTMLDLVHNRALDTLSFLRPLVVGPVARSFIEWGWIDSTDMEMALVDARARVAEEDPAKAKFLFKKDNKNEDSDMEL